MSLIDDLQSFQRNRVWHLKSRNMVHNRLRATVAGRELGYSTSLPEKQRAELFAQADRLIKAVVAGQQTTSIDHLIVTTWSAIKAFQDAEAEFHKRMEALAKKLPVAPWVMKPEQKGFGMFHLATLVGECGDLSNYANPGKLWRRMGCAPFTSDERTLMGSTWRKGKEGKLSAAEWSEYGYSPRRRSIMFVIAEGLMKQNGAGPYRARYDEAKDAAAASHADWSKMRCHLHGLLLTGKRLLRELWIEWHKQAGVKSSVTESMLAGL